MAKASTKKPTRKTAGRVASPRLPQIKQFRLVSYYETSDRPHNFISHILLEMGRLGLALGDVERRHGGRYDQYVLSDLLRWLTDHPGDAMAELTSWHNIDQEVMQHRLARDRRAKPRIEINTEITSRHNLSVRWYPRGWSRNELRSKPEKGPSPSEADWCTRFSDFNYFDPHYKTTMVARPLNELMFIHGVGSLYPDPNREYGPYSTHNRDVFDALCLYAVRSAFNLLIGQLRQWFDVAIRQDFEFDMVHEDIEGTGAFDRDRENRVVAWRIVDKEVPPLAPAAPVIPFVGR